MNLKCCCLNKNGGCCLWISNIRIFVDLNLFRISLGFLLIFVDLNYDLANIRIVVDLNFQNTKEKDLCWWWVRVFDYFKEKDLFKLSSWLLDWIRKDLFFSLFAWGCSVLAFLLVCPLVLVCVGACVGLFCRLLLFSGLPW